MKKVDRGGGVACVYVWEHARFQIEVTPEMPILSRCSLKVEVYDWDYGSVVVDPTGLGERIDGERMSGNPHIIRLVPKNPVDIYQRSRMAVSIILLTEYC